MLKVKESQSKKERKRGFLFPFCIHCFCKKCSKKKPKIKKAEQMDCRGEKYGKPK